jgi:hypothetical protein
MACTVRAAVATEAEALRRKDPDRYRRWNPTECLAAVLRLSLDTMSADSTRPEVSGGKRVVFLRFRRSRIASRQSTSPREPRLRIVDRTATKEQVRSADAAGRGRKTPPAWNLTCSWGEEVVRHSLTDHLENAAGSGSRLLCLTGIDSHLVPVITHTTHIDAEAVIPPRSADYLSALTRSRWTAASSAECLVNVRPSRAKSALAA